MFKLSTEMKIRTRDLEISVVKLKRLVVEIEETETSE